MLVLKGINALTLTQIIVTSVRIDSALFAAQTFELMFMAIFSRFD